MANSRGAPIGECLFGKATVQIQFISAFFTSTPIMLKLKAKVNFCTNLAKVLGAVVVV
jgi:hypothetical protein